MKRILLIHSNAADMVKARQATVCDDEGVGIYHVTTQGKLLEQIAGLQYSGFVELPGVRLNYEERSQVLSRCRWVR